MLLWGNLNCAELDGTSLAIVARGLRYSANAGDSFDGGRTVAEPSVIEKACLQLALTYMMDRQPVIADDVRDLAARYTAIAMQRLYAPLNRTP